MKRLKDGSWYWHLFFDGDRINGGLAVDEEAAMYAVKQYTGQHQHGHLNQQYVFDVETQEWISKNDLRLL